jgi:hypothetical protein
MKSNAILERVYLGDRTLGSIYIDGKLMCKTLELPWKDNKRRISCIPEGDYQVTKEQPIPANDPSGRRERKYIHFRIHNVSRRDGILIHRGTKPPHSKGCIVVGMSFTSSSLPELVDSKTALDLLANVLPEGFILTIKSKGA